MKRYHWQGGTIRNTVTIRQVLRDWHHRPISSVKIGAVRKFFLLLPIRKLGNERDIGVRKFLSQSNQSIKIFRAF